MAILVTILWLIPSKEGRICDIDKWLLIIDDELRTMNHEQWTMNYEQWTAYHEPSVVSYVLYKIPPQKSSKILEIQELATENSETRHSFSIILNSKFDPGYSMLDSWSVTRPLSFRARSTALRVDSAEESITTRHSAPKGKSCNSEQKKLRQPCFWTENDGAKPKIRRCHNRFKSPDSGIIVVWDSLVGFCGWVFWLGRVA